jgi:hypothetical protein
MSNYTLQAIIPPSLVAQEKKEERRKVLEAAQQRRKELSQRFKKRMQRALEQADIFDTGSAFCLSGIISLPGRNDT